MFENMNKLGWKCSQLILAAFCCKLKSVGESSTSWPSDIEFHSEQPVPLEQYSRQPYTLLH